MPKVTANGVEMNYTLKGEGFPLVLVHGYRGSQGDWIEQEGPLSKYFRLVLFDVRGHGMSEKPPSLEAYSIAIFAEDLYQLLRSLNIDGCYLMGQSMGGMVALEFLFAYREMVKALVLVSTAAGDFQRQLPPEVELLLAKRESLLHRLHEIDVPTLIVVGDRDKTFLEPSKLMHQLIPDSELCILNYAGHRLPLESPGRFNPKLLNFLRRVERAQR